MRILILILGFKGLRLLIEGVLCNAPINVNPQGGGGGGGYPREID